MSKAQLATGQIVVPGRVLLDKADTDRRCGHRKSLSRLEIRWTRKREPRPLPRVLRRIGSALHPDQGPASDCQCLPITSHTSRTRLKALDLHRSKTVAASASNI